MDIAIKKINEKMVSEINAILEYGKLQHAELNLQDFLQARVYRDKKVLQFESLLEDLVDLRNLYSPHSEQFSKEDFVSALGGLINQAKNLTSWE